jgi:hypothetical protein
MGGRGIDDFVIKYEYAFVQHIAYCPNKADTTRLLEPFLEQSKK